MTFVPEGAQLEQFLDICLKNHYQTSSSHVGVQWVNRESPRILAELHSAHWWRIGELAELQQSLSG